MCISTNEYSQFTRNVVRVARVAVAAAAAAVCFLPVHWIYIMCIYTVCYNVTFRIRTKTMCRWPLLLIMQQIFCVLWLLSVCVHMLSYIIHELIYSKMKKEQRRNKAATTALTHTHTHTTNKRSFYILLNIKAQKRSKNKKHNRIKRDTNRKSARQAHVVWGMANDCDEVTVIKHSWCACMRNNIIARCCAVCSN